jgi:hypothetical protein
MELGVAREASTWQQTAAPVAEVRASASSALYDYLVLTAAITRPDLHSQIFPHHLRFIGKARVKWLINVDDIGSGASVDETIANLQRILAAPNIDLEFLRSSKPGCFYQAARRLALRAGELLDNCRTGVLWLEDDWRLIPFNPVQRLLRTLRLGTARNRFGHRLRTCTGDLLDKQAALERAQLPSNSDWFISLVPRSRVSFNPGIWSKSFFERAMWQPLAARAVDQVDDPESLCADPWNAAEAYRRVTVFVDPLFQDAGRQWSTEHGLTKWQKAPDELAQRGSVTYTTSIPATSKGAPPSQFTGWITIVGGKWARLLPLIGRIAYRNGHLTAKLLAYPYLSFDLHPTAPGTANVYLHRLHRWTRTYPYRKLDARVSWSTNDLSRLQVATRHGTFVAVVSQSMPISALWMAPLQGLVGHIIYAMTLLGRLFRLDADKKIRHSPAGHRSHRAAVHEDIRAGHEACRR